MRTNAATDEREISDRRRGLSVMSLAFTSLPARAGDGLVHVVIDTPRGSRNKYKVDERLGTLKLSRVLPPGHRFPCDFGSIPGTRADDGDALDALVLGDEPYFPGCLVVAHLIGVLEARQTEAGKTLRNDRLLSVPEAPGNLVHARTLDDVDPRWLDGVEHFFISYNEAHGRHFEPIGRRGPDVAERLLEAAIAKAQAR
jgi:inorganic pyrophosphatase